ncbi:MAG: hypothetical protein ACYTFZ_08950, partial [Planctomycetota bacterium]
APESEGAQGDAYQEALAAFKSEGEGAAKSDGAGGETKPAGPSEKSEAKTVDPDELADEIYQRVKARDEIDADVRQVVKSVLGDTGADPEIAESWLDRVWRKDPDVRDAFVGRKGNLKAWGIVETGLKERFAAKMGVERADKKATQDRDAVTSAVHSASKVAPAPEKSVWQMTKAEFNAEQRRLGVKPH